MFFFEYSRNFEFFLKEHLRKAAKATCTYFNVTYDSTFQNTKAYSAPS